jgi:hypothetical protein
LLWETKLHFQVNIRQNWSSVYLSLYVALVANGQTEVSGSNDSRHCSYLMGSLISACIQFWFISLITVYFSFATFLKDLLPIFMLWFCPPFIEETGTYA